MKYRQVGKSGLRISELGLGSWITYGSALDENSSEKCIQTAYELGINFFDTANMYGFGSAEEVLGKALSAYPRESYVLATKVYAPMGDGPNDRGLSRKHIIEQCNASLRRLGTEYIDLYQFHKYDDSVPLEESLWAINDLISQGKVLYYGVSQWSAVQIIDALRICEKNHFRKPISDQPRYNMLERDIEEEIGPVCEREGLGLVVFSPLAQGLLTGKYRLGKEFTRGSRATTEEGKGFILKILTNENLTKVEKLNSIAEKLEMSLSQLALAWILRLPVISSAIIGASRPEQINENLKSLDVKLADEIFKEIDDVLKSN